MPDNSLESDWVSGIQPLIPAIQAAAELALQSLAGDNPDRSRKTDNTCLTDYLVREIARQVPGATTVPSGGGDEWILLPGVAVLRVKATDPELRVRNIRTSRYENYLSHGEIPGLPSALPWIELCYRHRAGAMAFQRLCLTERNTEGVVASLDLPCETVESQTGIVALELELPKTRVKPKTDVAAKRAKKGKSGNE